MIEQLDEIIEGIRKMKTDGLKSLDQDIRHYIPSAKCEMKSRHQFNLSTGFSSDGGLTNSLPAKSVSKKTAVRFSERRTTPVDHTITASDLINGRTVRKLDSDSKSAAALLSETKQITREVTSRNEINPILSNFASLLEQKEREASSHNISAPFTTRDASFQSFDDASVSESFRKVKQSTNSVLTHALSS
eukprot:GDKJ01057041.1.p1 GENE.GDKJ01057041.1~~GDKJ01057041.1.p1  ORF type:complete len:190 (+),score=29.87 GDKJ01057041.1:87-656(+)